MPDDRALQDLDEQLLAQMLEDFMEESLEHLDQLNFNLTQLEEDPENQELIGEIFRAVHTLKGTASFVGLDQIREVSHHMEDVFGAIRQGTLKVTPEVIDTMFEGLEILVSLRDRVASKAPGGDSPADLSPILQKLVAILEDTVEPTPSPGNANNSPAAPEAPKTKRTVFSSETIRVPTQRLDTLMNLVGELITSRNRLTAVSERTKDEELGVIASTITRLTGLIHHALLGVRMVSIERLFKKFPGVVRNLARERNKEVELIITGQDTELDKIVSEQIYDPLIHLLRNAVDHGIESPEARVAQGKPPVGQIRLSARGRQDHIIIEVSDDGRGIDPERVKAQAVQKGFITEEEARLMNDQQAVWLVLTPGFSTAAEVSDISGRGVGLDVVRENVHRMRGMVEVHSEVGRGTTFRIQIPLSLAILQVLLVKAAGLTYALPLSTVRETLLLDPAEISTLDKNEVVFIRGTAHPLKKLSAILARGAPVDREPGNGRIPVVVVGLAEKRLALAVDELLGKQEVVMKSLGDYLGRVKGVEGVSILADGSITLIVDVGLAFSGGDV